MWSPEKCIIEWANIYLISNSEFGFDSAECVWCMLQGWQWRDGLCPTPLLSLFLSLSLPLSLLARDLSFIHRPWFHFNIGRSILNSIKQYRCSISFALVKLVKLIICLRSHFVWSLESSDISGTRDLFSQWVMIFGMSVRDVVFMLFHKEISYSTFNTQCVIPDVHLCSFSNSYRCSVQGRCGPFYEGNKTLFMV